MTGISSYAANKVFDAILNNQSFAVTVCYVQLHIGDPGAAGTSNQATDTTRKAVPGASPAGGEITTDSVITWAPIAAPPGGEDATHFSLWDASTGGNFIGSGTITAQPYNNGDTVTIAAGDLDLALTVAT